MSVIIEDLQEESIPPITQLNPPEAIPFKFERTDTAIFFTNHLGKEILFNR